ncbi:MAG TPA: hypothetical protein VJA22_03100, partial [Patescibacteria group bacterium]|nr:hypothetical protein [Patescibacteria group bacterium]
MYGLSELGSLQPKQLLEAEMRSERVVFAVAVVFLSCLCLMGQAECPIHEPDKGDVEIERAEDSPRGSILVGSRNV